MLRIRTYTPSLSPQCNGTDCGIFTLLYQQAVSNWYGAAAGQTFSDAQIRELLNALCTINQATASRHREWIRTHMHTWWRESWEGTDPITPPGEHQRQVQQRRQRRRVQDPGVVESQPTDHSTTQSDDSNTTGLAQDLCISSAKETFRTTSAHNCDEKTSLLGWIIGVGSMTTTVALARCRKSSSAVRK